MPAKKTVAGLMLIPLMCAAVLWLAACGEGDPCTRGSSELVSRGQRKHRGVLEASA